MSGYDVRTCAFCGRLFQSFGQNVCPECGDRLDEDFVKIRTYLYDHENQTITEITEKTGVPEKAVLFLMKEGRLSRKSASPDAGLKCSMCGAPITSGRLCQKCLRNWNSELGGSGGGKGGGKDGGKDGEIQKEPVKTGSRMHTEHF